MTTPQLDDILNEVNDILTKLEVPEEIRGEILRLYSQIWDPWKEARLYLRRNIKEKVLYRLIHNLKRDIEERGMPVSHGGIGKIEVTYWEDRTFVIEVPIDEKISKISYVIQIKGTLTNKNEKRKLFFKRISIIFDEKSFEQYPSHNGIRSILLNYISNKNKKPDYVELVIECTKENLPKLDHKYKYKLVENKQRKTYELVLKLPFIYSKSSSKSS